MLCDCPIGPHTSNCGLYIGLGFETSITHPGKLPCVNSQEGNLLVAQGKHAHQLECSARRRVHIRYKVLIDTSVNRYVLAEVNTLR